jgi:thiamine-phosphate pyrophosphorylase
MRCRQTLPQLWMMTDERQGEALWAALRRLPRGAGVVFRHYGLARDKRRALFERIVRIAGRRGLVLFIAGPALGERAWQVDGVHGRPNSAGLRSASAHNLQEIRAAERRGADVLFVSPVFATRSHPGAMPLGPLRFALLARHTRLPVIALGGMTPERVKRLQGSAIYGWAAIDAWTAL